MRNSIRNQFLATKMIFHELGKTVHNSYKMAARFLSKLPDKHPNTNDESSVVYYNSSSI